MSKAADAVAECTGYINAMDSAFELSRLDQPDDKYSIAEAVHGSLKAIEASGLMEFNMDQTDDTTANEAGMDAEAAVAGVVTYLEAAHLNPPGEVAASEREEAQGTQWAGEAFDVGQQRTQLTDRGHGHEEVGLPGALRPSDGCCEAGGPGGSITLHTFYEPSLRLQREDGSAARLPLQIEIIDDGPGLPKEIASDVFEPFISGKENGTGLGLALVSKLIADVGGWISVESIPGRTVFRVSLPIVPKEYKED